MQGGGFVAPRDHKMEAEVFIWLHAALFFLPAHIHHHFIPSLQITATINPTAEMSQFSFFLPFFFFSSSLFLFSLMNTRSSRLDGLFKCMIAVYDIVMDLESIIISLFKTNQTGRKQSTGN